MGAIQMQLGYKASTLELPYAFIDNYLTGCAPVYPLIYIYSLRRLIGGDPVSVREIAEHFGLLDTDVLNAWRHFEKVGLVKLEGTPPDISVTFLPVSDHVSDTMRAVSVAPPTVVPEKGIVLGVDFGETKPPEIHEVHEFPKAQEAPEVTRASIGPAHNNLPQFLSKERPRYSPEELEIYHTQSQEIRRLYSKGEQAFGRLLNYNDMNLIFGLYDWLRLPPDVIDFLLSYCIEDGHTDLRYIETCAINWANRGIDDLEKALTHVQGYDNNYRSILRQLGKTTFPSPAQQKLMNKWLRELQMPLEVILDACDRTTISAEKPSLSYVDKIIAKWHKSGITTLEGIKQADEEFNQKREQKIQKAQDTQKNQEAKGPAKASRPKNNRFINFDQRDNDYTQIEQMAQQRLLQRLKG